MTMIYVLSFIGGLAMLLFGMQIMSGSLRRLADGKLSQILENMTSSPVKGVLWGTGITAVIQSSSVATVTVVGLTNAGMIRLRQAIAVIMGANIGTTCTAWLLGATGIESSNLFLQLLKPSSFSPVLALIGIFILLFAKESRGRDAGMSLLGFSVLLFGMMTMTEAVSPLTANGWLSDSLLRFDNPFLCLLTGIAVTSIFQSSSTVTGILQAVAFTGAMPFSFAVPALLGAEIGTCVSALVSSVGTSAEARRAALAHLMFNLIGVAAFMLIYVVIWAVADVSLLYTPISAVGIAAFHCSFNVLCAAALLPFIGQMEKLMTKLIKDKHEENFDAIVLEKRFLASPSFAAKHGKNAVLEITSLVHENVIDAINLLQIYDEAVFCHMQETKTLFDEYETRLRRYLTELSRKELSRENGDSLTEMLCCEVLLKQIDQLALGLADTAKEKRSDLKVGFEEPLFRNACTSISSMINGLFGELTEAGGQRLRLEMEAERMRDLRRQTEKFVEKQMTAGIYSPGAAIALLSVMADFERIGFCCAEISSLISRSDSAYRNMMRS